MRDFTKPQSKNEGLIARQGAINTLLKNDLEESHINFIEAKFTDKQGEEFYRIGDIDDYLNDQLKEGNSYDD